MPGARVSICAEGGRTGLASVVTAALFAVSLFFIPLFEPMQALQYAYAPALLIVGMLMLSSIVRIDYDDLTRVDHLVRDVVAERQGTDMERSFGTARAEMAPSQTAEDRQPERAMASQGWGEQRKLDLVDDDKPIASPDIPAAHDRDKPR